jgi:hypothetical protein
VFKDKIEVNIRHAKVCGAVNDSMMLKEFKEFFRKKL